MAGGFDCQTCGACCVEAGPVPVYDHLDRHVPRYLTRSVRNMAGFASWEADHGTRRMADHMGGRCVALRGEVGCSVRCAIYDRRPTACATFEPGSEGCLAARERMQAKRARLEWKPHGYGPNERDGAFAGEAA